MREGSEFAPAAVEVSGGVYLVGSVTWWFFSKLMGVDVSIRDSSPG